MNIRFDRCVNTSCCFVPRIDFYWNKKLIMVSWLKLPILVIDFRKDFISDLMHGIN